MCPPAPALGRFCADPRPDVRGVPGSAFSCLLCVSGTALCLPCCPLILSRLLSLITSYSAPWSHRKDGTPHLVTMSSRDVILGPELTLEASHNTPGWHSGKIMGSAYDFYEFGQVILTLRHSVFLFIKQK